MFIDAAGLAGRRAALIVAHPGHELRVHRWLELARPDVFVLTDGSGRTARSRVPSTTTVLTSAGATPASVYGRFTDIGLYDIVRTQDVEPLAALMRELAHALSVAGVEYVVADALEGFNPSHDICRFVTNGAVSLLRQETGRALNNFDFLLDGSPAAFLGESSATPIVRIELDDAALTRKIDAAEQYVELQAETASALARFGRSAFATELLRPVDNPRQGLERMSEDPPYYERFGEQQVRAGHYQDVIRYRTHVQPLVNALWREVGLESGEPDRSPAVRVSR